MAIGNAVLDIVLGDGFLDHVERMANQFRQVLAELVDTYPDLLEDARGGDRGRVWTGRRAQGPDRRQQPGAADPREHPAASAKLFRNLRCE